jgi:hypothetical protein
MGHRLRFLCVFLVLAAVNACGCRGTGSTPPAPDSAAAAGSSLAVEDASPDAVASSEASYARAAAAGRDPGATGHYDDTSWSGLDAPGGYDDLEVDITVEAWDMGDRKDAYYYAHDVKFANGKNAYGGLQGGRYFPGRPATKGVIFSVWDVSNSIAEDGGTRVAFSTEGAGQSVHLPYDWEVGVTYRFAFYLDQDATQGDRLWGASVTDLRSGRTTRVGRIYVPVAFGKIRHPITFHERDRGDKRAPCEDISPSRVRFAGMTANHGAVRATGFAHSLKRTVPGCPEINWFEDLPNGYVNGINAPHP